MSSDGTIRTPVEEASVVEAARKLLGRGAEILVVAFLNSWASPTNEQKIKEIVGRKWPNVTVVTSADVVPEPLEYERFSAATITAYLKPRISGYLDHMQKSLREVGLKGGFMIMQSSGGLMAPEVAKQNCALMIECGPAAGVIGAAQLGKALGHDNIIAFDMGGTTAKTCVVYGGSATVSYENVKERFPLNLPMLDTVSIGAGGGSKAWVDAQGGLHVGPDSAGADPGPACYGKGNTVATVTDAHVSLGRLLPEHFLGGRMKIYAEMSRNAVKDIADRYGLTIEEAAAGILRIVNSNMANLIRGVTIEKGHDPRDFVMLAYGGAGPMHAGILAQELGIPSVVVPPFPGIFSAWGMTVADIKHDFVRAIVTSSKRLDLAGVDSLFQEMEEEAKALLQGEAVAPEDIRLEYLMDMRYVGQAYIPCTVEIPRGKMNPEKIRAAVRDFNELHNKYYKWSAANEEVEVVNMRIAATGLTKKPSIRRVPPKAAELTVVTRDVYFEGAKQSIPTSFYNRDELPTWMGIEGPAVVYQYDGTTIVYPGQKCTVDEFGNLVIAVK
jgi:N-methylhydantoinase A